MKKKTIKTKLTLNKFKVASISNFGKSKIYGGGGTDDGTTDSIVKDGTINDITNAPI